MFGLTKQQEMLMKMVKEFAANELEPIADQVDKTGRT